MTAELELAQAAVSVAASVAVSVARSAAQSVMTAALSLLKAKALRLATWMRSVSFAPLASSLPQVYSLVSYQVQLTRWLVH